MYDQSINTASIAKALTQSDFNLNKSLLSKAAKDRAISSAVGRGRSGGWETSPLRASMQRKKHVYSLPNFSDELLIRKINSNIRHFFKIRHPSRTSIIPNLARICAEGVHYRIYRLDIKSFYESFTIGDVIKKIDEISGLSVPSKKLLRNLFAHFASSGGNGIPRGLGISATLSEIMMSDFDRSIRINKNVFFYARYVDDIIIVTSGIEDEKKFLKNIELDLLPTGLRLSRSKLFIKTIPKVASKSTFTYNFEYLGYNFLVKDQSAKDKFRKVTLGIADSKIRKIKTKVVLALQAYSDDLDFGLLTSRIKVLTGNFSVPDEYRVKKKLAGIYYNYNLIDSSSQTCGLPDLDRFLKCAILSGEGAVFSRFFAASTYKQRKILLGCTFKNGFEGRHFLYFSALKMYTIQRCWKYA